MPLQVTLGVTDQSTGLPITGAAVFIDGQNQDDSGDSGLVTNSTGLCMFTMQTVGSHELIVTATGYTTGAPQTFTVSSSTNVPQILSAILTPVTGSSAPINMVFVPAVGAISWTILNSSAVVIDSGVSSQTGTATSNASLLAGTYTINASLAGYSNTTDPIIVPGVSPYQVVLIQNANLNTPSTGTSSASSPNSTSTPSSIVSQTTISSPDSEEFIYPNTDYDKYFTVIGARIYIGDLFIDELNSIQYALQDNAMPIYGYASRFVDAYGQGRSLVQGQFTLNFVSEGYLYTVLQEYAQFLSSTQGTGFPINSPNVDIVAQVLSLMAARNNLMQASNNNPNYLQPTPTVGVNQLYGQYTSQPLGTVPSQGQVTSTEQIAGATAVNPSTQITAYNTQIQSLMQGMSATQIQALSEQQLKTITDPVGFANGVYQDVVFDIRLEFGNEVTGVQRTRYLEKCKLIANEQVIDQSGQVILDSYGFIARRLR